jgi:xanthine dehydrogenase iron-sulfur cluster and FAD-binding subunit A
VSSARVFFGGVGAQLFRASTLEAALVGQPLSQSTLEACLTGLTTDINKVGPSTYYGTTDAYRRQVAASLVYKARPRVCCVLVAAFL